MTTDIWFISDTHFSHYNLVMKFVREDGSPAREFDTVQEHDEFIIKNWNERVKVTDKIYHLGDVIMGPREAHPKLLSRLNGKKRLLLGNHDIIKGTDLLKYFQKLGLWRIFKEHNFVCSHLPMRPEQFRKA